MLVSHGHATLGKASLRSALVLAPRVALVVLDRSGLRFDSRFVPAAAEPERAHAFLYFLLSGTFAIADGPTFRGPACFLLSEEQFEGASGKRPFAFRTSGEPFQSIEVHVESARLGAVRPARIPPSIDLDEDIWKKCHDVLDARTDDALATAATALVDGLAARGVVSASVVPRSDGPVASSRLWSVVRPVIERHAPLSRLKELGTDLSIRQLARDLETFASVYALVMRGGWRQTMSRYRLKLAVLFASAEHASVADIAKLVGYGDGDALARAFREAKLPAPRELQRRLLHTHE